MSEQQHRIKVDFPDKINVTSPELDGLKESTRSISNVLSEHLIAIARSIQSLTELPDLIKKLRITVTENFGNLFKAGIEADVMNRQAAIKVIESKTGFVQTHIEKKKKHAVEAIGFIKSDYEKYFEAIAKEQDMFLQKLDSHAYELVEKVYPKQIQAKFSLQSLPCLDFMAEHISDSAILRTNVINTALRDAENEVDKFIEERQMFYGEVDRMGISSLAEGGYTMECYTIDIEDNETGHIERKYIFPWGFRQDVGIAEGEFGQAIDEKADCDYETKSETSKLFWEKLRTFVNLDEEGWRRFEEDCAIKLREE